MRVLTPEQALRYDYTSHIPGLPQEAPLPAQPTDPFLDQAGGYRFSHDPDNGFMTHDQLRGAQQDSLRSRGAVYASKAAVGNEVRQYMLDESAPLVWGVGPTV